MRCIPENGPMADDTDYEGGDGMVRASVANRPLQYLDLSVRLRLPGPSI